MKNLADSLVEWFASVAYTFGVAFITWIVLAFTIWAALYYPLPNPKTPDIDWRIPISRFLLHGYLVHRPAAAINEYAIPFV